MKRSTLIPRRSLESLAQPQPFTPLTIHQATESLFDRKSILLLAKRIQKVRNRALAWERRFGGDLQKVTPGFRPSARNLLHYLAPAGSASTPCETTFVNCRLTHWEGKHASPGH